MPLHKILIDGKESLDAYGGLQISHLLTISNPGCMPPAVEWFCGERLDIFFGDVLSPADAVRYNTKAPTLADIEAAVRFGSTAFREAQARLLVCCDYGASRSPAVAYVMLAHYLGEGREGDAFSHILEIRPDAVPNSLVVALGDEYLHRHGRMVSPLREHNRNLEEEIVRSLF